MNLNERIDYIIRKNPSWIKIRPVVMKEIIHYDIFAHLRLSGLMPDTMTFIGGTCLRLCHGSNRFSEDLDFHAGPMFQSMQFDRLRESLERHLNDNYGLKVVVNEPSQLKNDPDYANTTASTWKVIVETHPGQQNLPRQKAHIDIANLPTYESEPDILKVNFAGLPDGYDSILVNRSSANEILADKMVALAARPNIKARDLWDIQWLQQQGNVVDLKLVNLKIADHGIHNFESLLEAKQAELGQYWSTDAFNSEMSRFLDSTRLSEVLLNPNFQIYIRREIYKTIDRTLRGMVDDYAPDFSM